MDFRVQGMDCSEEVSLLRRALSKVVGVYELHFEIIQARMTVEFDPKRTSVEAIQAAAARVGLRCEPWDSEARPDRVQQFVRLRRRLAYSSLALLIAGMALQ